MSSLSRRCRSWRAAAKSLSSSASSNCLRALERSLGSTCRDDNFPAVLTTQRAAVRMSGVSECDKTLERLPPVSVVVSATGARNRRIIAPRRTNSAHLHRPWRARFQWLSLAQQPVAPRSRRKHSESSEQDGFGQIVAPPAAVGAKLFVLRIVQRYVIEHRTLHWNT